MCLSVKVVIGDRCKIQNNVSVYDNVTLEDGVFCGVHGVCDIYNPRSLIERKNEYRDLWSNRSYRGELPWFAVWKSMPLWARARWCSVMFPILR